MSEKLHPTTNNLQSLTKRSFPIVGMHCASCAKLISRSLQKVPGVINADVNYASEQATIEADSGIQDSTLADAVKKAGYKAIFVNDQFPSSKLQTISIDQNTNIQNVMTADELKEVEKFKELKKLRNKVIFSTVLTIPVFIGAMGEMLPFVPMSFTEPLFQLILSTPVIFWAGWEFFQATWSGLKNRTASMDTLIAIGTTAAYGYSLYSIFFGGYVYFETAAVIVTLILLGRLLEAKAKLHTSDAIKKLLGLQAKTARVIRNNQEIDIPLQHQSRFPLQFQHQPMPEQVHR